MGKVVNINKSKTEEIDACSDCSDCHEDMFDMAKDFIFEMIMDEEICEEQKWAYLHFMREILNDILPDKEDLN